MSPKVPKLGPTSEGGWARENTSENKAVPKAPNYPWI